MQKVERDSISFGDAEIKEVAKGNELNLKSLSFVQLPCRPLFIDKKDKAPFPYMEIGKHNSCLCNRFNFVAPPVSPQGSKDSLFVFIGQSPGTQEMEHGVPFYHRAPGGRLLNEYLSLLELGRQDIYITNVVFCGMPNDQPPTADEIFACSVFHYEEFLSLKKVRYIIPLGTYAFNFITGIYSSITPYVGSYFKTKLFDNDVTIIPVHHPGTCLRRGTFKQQTFRLLASLAGKEDLIEDL